MTARSCARSASTSRKLRTAVFVLGTMLAAAAGIIVAPIWGIRPHMGVDAVVPAFLVIVLGGVGSLLGRGHGRARWSAWWSVCPAPTPRNGRCSRCICSSSRVVTFRARGLFGKKSMLEA